MWIDSVASAGVRALERPAMLDILVCAFRDDPAIRGLYPADLEYVVHFPGLALSRAESAFEIDTVTVEGDHRGAALWLPPGADADADDMAMAAYLKGSVPRPRLMPVLTALEALRALRPAEPHWRLAWIAVMPEAQAMGIGTTLLAEGLARADRDGMPVHVEVTNPRCAPLFERHGFSLRGRLALPAGTKLIAMGRHPGGRP